MKKKYAKATLKSFSQLRSVCESVWGGVSSSTKKLPKVPKPMSSTFGNICRPQEDDDLRLFRDAMLGVKAKDERQERQERPLLQASLSETIVKEEKSKGEGLRNLDKLLAHGIGSSLNFPKNFIQRQDRIHPVTDDMCYGFGRFSCDSLDLHGHTVAEAKVAVDNFLEESILLGRPSVLIIHGKGLLSPGDPILKNKVSEWLRRGMRLKLLRSFSGARPEDGGAGATYVEFHDNE